LSFGDEVRHDGRVAKLGGQVNSRVTCKHSGSVNDLSLSFTFILVDIDSVISVSVFDISTVMSVIISNVSPTQRSVCIISVLL